LCSVRSLRAGQIPFPTSSSYSWRQFFLSYNRITGFDFLLPSFVCSPELFLVRHHRSLQVPLGFAFSNPHQWISFSHSGTHFSRSPPVCTYAAVIPCWLFDLRVVRLVFVLAPSSSCFGFCSRELLACQGFGLRARSGFPAQAAIF
jgi:hypothetical protein